MASYGKALGESLKRLFLRELTVARVSRLSEHFARVELVGESLCGVHFSTGDKLQIAFDGGTRTYTPCSFDGQRGALSIVIYFHGDGLGARWGQSATEGERVYALGPRRSLALAADAGPLALFGDETSFGLAQALVGAKAAAGGSSFVFEATSASESNAVLSALGVPDPEIVERRAQDLHLSGVDARLRAIFAREPTTRLVLTGKAPSIQALRKRLAIDSVRHAGQLVKAYWSPGKRGLD